MKTESSICLASFTNDGMAKRYLEMNTIRAAFVYREGPRTWEVLEGNPETLCGFKAATFTTKREADAFCAQLNARIAALAA